MTAKTNLPEQTLDSLQAERNLLLHQLRIAQKDTERLNWYEGHHTLVVGIIKTWYSRRDYIGSLKKHLTLREAIDEASASIKGTAI